MNPRFKGIAIGLAIGLALFAGGAVALGTLYPIPSNMADGKGYIPYTADGNNLTMLAPGVAGQPLISGGANAAPSFGAPSFGGGTPVTGLVVYSQTITPTSVTHPLCAEQTFTVTGLATTDKVFVNPAATGNSTSMTQARVSATNTLALMFCNPTAGDLTPGAGTYNILAIRS